MPSQLPPPLPPPSPPSGGAGPIPYATPSPPGATGPVFHVGVFAWSAAVLGVWLILMLVVVGKFREIFMDFKLQLNPAGRVLFGIERVLAAGGWVLVLAVPVGLGFAAARLTPGGRRVLRMLATIAFGALVLLAVLGLVTPLTQLIGGMGGGGRGGR